MERAKKVKGKIWEYILERCKISGLNTPLKVVNYPHLGIKFVYGEGGFGSLYITLSYGPDVHKRV